MADIRTTTSIRTPPRAELEKQAAEGLLQKKISLAEYRELVKPNLTEADLQADLGIAAKIMVNGFKEGGTLINDSMNLANKLLEAIELDAPPAFKAKIEELADRAMEAVIAAEPRAKTSRR